MTTDVQNALVKALLDSETLYHYCSSNTFQQIVTNGTIRLSSLTLSNDSLEGKLVKDVVRRIANADKLDYFTCEKLIGRVSDLEKLFDGLGLCLSKVGDLLSQWRGYGDDGYGVSIGFSRRYLDHLSAKQRSKGLSGFSVQDVVYDPVVQDERLQPDYQRMKPFIAQGALRGPFIGGLLSPAAEEEPEAEALRKSAEKNLSDCILLLFQHCFTLKSAAFAEEQEVRLLSYLTNSNDDAVKHRATRSAIVPYREFTFEDREKMMPITHVVLGPRHATPIQVVEKFLWIEGFGRVKVTKSAASYR